MLRGYCFECEYEGKFKNRHRCPKCKSEDIEISDEDEYYDSEDENENDDDYVNFDDLETSESEFDNKSGSEKD